MGRTLRHERGRQSVSRQAAATTDREGDAAAIDDRDTDRRGDSASNTSDGGRNGQDPRDRSKQAKRSDEAQPQHDEINEVARGITIEGTHQQDGQLGEGSEAMKLETGDQPSEEDDDYFTARDEPATEATTSRARRESSEAPSFANPL